VRQYISYSQSSRELMIQRREVFYAIFMEFRVPIKQVRLAKMCAIRNVQEDQVGLN
jgi:hypothetical protein